MSKVEELKNVLENGVLPELNSEIEALKELISKKSNKELELEINYLNDVIKFYNEALRLINEGKLSQDEAENILLDLDDMEDDEGDI